jgi:hypothetical protein
MPEENAKVRNDESDWPIMCGLLIAVFAVIYLWYWVPDHFASRVSPHSLTNSLPNLVEHAGQVSDKYGSVNALFSGLAFAVLIATLLLQRKELKQNTEELQNQANALDSQVELMRLSAKVAALPTLIQQERERVYTAGGKNYEAVAEQSFSIEVSTAEVYISRVEESLRHAEEGN